MRRIVVPLLAMLLCGFGAGNALADASGWHHFWYDFKAGYHRNLVWPHPHVHQDRAAVYGPLAMQVHNGWRLQNLLNEHHFDHETGALNNAGESKVRWILTQAPEQYRGIYVQHADTPDATAARIESIQRLAARVDGGALPSITATHQQFRGWSADEINQMHVRYYSSFPAPRLPASSGAPGSGN